MWLYEICRGSINSIVHGVQVDLFYYGPGGELRTQIEQLIAEAGLHPVLGDREQVNLVASVGALSESQGTNYHLAFKVLTH